MHLPACMQGGDEEGDPAQLSQLFQPGRTDAGIWARWAGGRERSNVPTFQRHRSPVAGLPSPVAVLGTAGFPIDSQVRF